MGSAAYSSEAARQGKYPWVFALIDRLSAQEEMDLGDVHMIRSCMRVAVA